MCSCVCVHAFPLFAGMHYVWSMDPICVCLVIHPIITLRQWQNGCHFADNIFKCIFMTENLQLLIETSVMFVLHWHWQWLGTKQGTDHCLTMRTSAAYRYNRYHWDRYMSTDTHIDTLISFPSIYIDVTFFRFCTKYFQCRKILRHFGLLEWKFPFWL